VRCRPRRCSCRRQNLRSAPASTSRPFQLIAGSEVSINCRFWVSTEGATVCPPRWQRSWPCPIVPCCARWATAVFDGVGRIPFVTVVYNDNALSLIQVAQARRGYVDYGVRYGAIDFAAVSAALGAWSRRVTTLDELSAAVKEARALDVPAVIEVPIDPAEYHAHAAPPRQRRTPRVP
jgi:Thiamine pyrophosphate enzyme, C-terminal TPP binding domain